MRERHLCPNCRKEVMSIRLNNDEIKIYQEDMIVSKLLTKTTDRGDLFMPLIITNLSQGKYDVLAADKIRTATTSFEI